MTDDLFDDVEPAAPSLITGGRYRLPNRDGSHHSGGWMRASNLAAALSDQRALMLWNERTVLEGIHARPDLVDELTVMDLAAMDDATRRKELERFAEECKVAAKADAGSRRGNARHHMVHTFHTTGRETGTSEMRRQLASYKAVLEAHGLRPVPGMQERIVIVEELNCAGTFDNILEDIPNGCQLRIADLKTQTAFWSLLEVQAQLAIYSRADAIWNVELGRYQDMPAVDQDLGHVMWMPKDRPEGWPEDETHQVRILDIDLRKGWETAQLAKRIVEMRAEAKSTFTLRTMFRPLPTGAASTMRTVEEYARLFEQCETLQDGSRLLEEARENIGLVPEIFEAANRAAQRIKAAQA